MKNWKNTTDFLREIPLPEQTRTYKPVSHLMPEIREQFKWGNNFDENNNRLPITIWVLLKDMSTSHISGVIRYFTENIRPEQVLTKQWIAYHLIFCYELENRLKQ